MLKVKTIKKFIHIKVCQCHHYYNFPKFQYNIRTYVRGVIKKHGYYQISRVTHVQLSHFFLLCWYTCLLYDDNISQFVFDR